MHKRLATTAAMTMFGFFCGGCFTIGLHGGLPEMEERVVEDNDAGNKVAVVDVIGQLVLDQTPNALPFVGGSDNIIGRTKEQLDLAADDEDVKAVVVRISSPGGQVYPSLEIHRQLVRFREETGKPVVAYVPDVATSGAYLAAVGADEIIADHSAITGSIGVLLIVPEVSGLLQWIRVKVNVFKAGEKKDVGNPFRELTAEDRAEIMKIADYYHAKFKEYVDQGRTKLDAGQVETIADGRVFTAPEARDMGLVDAVGDLASAHDRAAQRAGLSAGATNLVMYRRPSGYGHNAYAMNANQFGGLQFNLDVGALAPRPQYLFLWQPGI